MSIRILWRSGGLAFLLALLLLVPNISQVSAASGRTSASSPQGALSSGTSTPTPTSTETAPHNRKGKKAREEEFSNPAPGNQPAPSSGATVIDPAKSLSGSSVTPYTLATSSFAGLGQNGSVPSDSNADVGPYNVLETVNSQFAVYDRSGNLQYNNTFASWFGSDGFDPDVIYDPWGGRFAFLIDTGSSILISVAQQTNALGNYCNYTYAIANFPDYPRIGFDENYLYFTVNDYNPTTQAYLYPILYQINLRQMESCSSASFWTWSQLTDPSGSYAFNVVPALKYNYNTSHDEEYLVDTIAGGACNVTVWRINNHVLSKNSVNTECYSPPPDGSQAGSSTTVPSSAKGKVLHQVTFRDNLLDFSLTTAYNWGNNNIKANIAWLKLDPVALTVSQQGIFGNPSYWFSFPALVQNSSGKTLVVFNAVNSSMYQSIWYLGQNADGSSQDTLALAWGSSANTSGRSGDYQSARLDPTDVTHIWICGQYAAAGNVWGTEIGDAAPS